MPVVLVTWVTAITRVRGVIAFSKAASSSSWLRGGTGTGRLLMRNPSRRARTFQAWLLEGWLWSVIRTSSPGFRSMPRITTLLPSLVLRRMAISSGVTRTSSASLARARSHSGPYLSRFWKEGLAWKSRRNSQCRSITGREAGQTLAALR